VQSSLFAVFLDLNQAETLDENARKQLAEKVRSASQSLDAGNETLRLPFAAALTQLTEGWGESLDFKVQVNAETAKSIDASEVGKACSIEVLREAINNAAKYGTGRVDISVDSAAEGLVRIQVLNPMAAMTSPATPGYGSTVLDQVTHQWGLKTENDQAVFTALVALAK
jgi:hypothetical protein